MSVISLGMSQNSPIELIYKTIENKHSPNLKCSNFPTFIEDCTVAKEKGTLDNLITKYDATKFCGQ